MKSAWDVVTTEIIRRERRAITRRDFPSLLSEVWKTGYKPQNAVGGFKHAGISPYNHRVIPDSALHYSEPFTRPCSSANSPTASEDSNDQQQDNSDQGESLVSQLQLPPASLTTFQVTTDHRRLVSRLKHLQYGHHHHLTVHRLPEKWLINSRTTATKSRVWSHNSNHLLNLILRLTKTYAVSSANFPTPRINRLWGEFNQRQGSRTS